MIWNLFKITSLMSAVRTLQTLDTMTKGVLVFGIIIFVQIPWTSPISPATLKAYGVDHNKKGKQTNYQGCGQGLKRHVALSEEKGCTSWSNQGLEMGQVKTQPEIWPGRKDQTQTIIRSNPSFFSVKSIRKWFHEKILSQPITNQGLWRWEKKEEKAIKATNSQKID